MDPCKPAITRRRPEYANIRILFVDVVEFTDWRKARELETRDVKSFSDYLRSLTPGDTVYYYGDEQYTVLRVETDNDGHPVIVLEEREYIITYLVPLRIVEPQKMIMVSSSISGGEGSGLWFAREQTSDGHVIVETADDPAKLVPADLPVIEIHSRFPRTA